MIFTLLLIRPQKEGMHDMLVLPYYSDVSNFNLGYVLNCNNKFTINRSFGWPFLVFLSSLTFSTISPSFKSAIGTSAFNSPFLPGIRMILLGKKENLGMVTQLLILFT